MLLLCHWLIGEVDLNILQGDGNDFNFRHASAGHFERWPKPTAMLEALSHSPLMVSQTTDEGDDAAIDWPQDNIAR